LHQDATNPRNQPAKLNRETDRQNEARRTLLYIQLLYIQREAFDPETSLGAEAISPRDRAATLENVEKDLKKLPTRLY